jgi:antitoxin (DNA-binding transcriptional repressor) of toxin-antitoxin stability system
MKSVTVRQVREALPKLEKLLAKHGELRITRRGKEIARLLPTGPRAHFPSLAEFRASMPFQDPPSEVLIREDRDAR